MIREFALFVREKGVIGLAVGIIVGGAITKFVTAIIKDLVNPIIGGIVGTSGTLTEYSLKIPLTNIQLMYGDLISEFINLITIMLVVYIIFVKSPVKRIDKKPEEKK